MQSIQQAPNVDRHSMETCTQSTIPPLTSVASHDVLQDNAKLDALQGQAYQAPDEIRASAAAGNPLAAVAFFNMAMSCTPFSGDTNVEAPLDAPRALAGKTHSR
jgi:hypothetical protein